MKTSGLFVGSFRGLVSSVVLTGFVIFWMSSPVWGQKRKSEVKSASAKDTSGKCSQSNGLTAEEINQLLSIHNHERAAQRVKPLQWECKLAETAQKWANGSVFAHREDSFYGENIFVSSVANESVSSMMAGWLGEKNYWQNKSGKCTKGKTCTHYTQIVWKTTARIGCGVNHSAKGKWKLMFVCNYDPTGNTGGPAF